MATAAQRAARAVVLALAGRIKVGELTVNEGGRTHVLGPGGPPDATIDILSLEAWPRLARGVRSTIEAHREGLWDSPDLAAALRIAARNIGIFDSFRRRIAFVRTPVLRALAVRRNTPMRSRKDIKEHYDLGNDMFALMLDPTMMYSCAVFSDKESTLEEAQLHKLELVCEKLNLGPTDHVLEIGAGWGGFAVYAATTRGCHVTTTTISKQQYDVATERVRAAGVEDLVEVLMDDYRELRGSYDKLVSLEMIEAVGYRDFGTFFKCCSNLLARDGAMLLQAITIDDRVYDVTKVSRGFITRYIFPNGCLPSARAIAESLAHRTDMREVHLEDFTPHYAETLRRWRANFDATQRQLDPSKYDAVFRRTWRAYLAYCEAGFEERRIALVQIVLAKPDCNVPRICASHVAVVEQDHVAARELSNSANGRGSGPRRNVRVAPLLEFRAAPLSEQTADPEPMEAP